MNASNPASYSLFTLWREIMSLFEATGHIGLPYLYLGCGFAKKALFFYFSSSLLCDAESTTTDNIVFRKPTSPPLTLREGPPLISVFSNSLYDPFGSPCRGQKPQGRRGNRPTRCSNRYAIRLADHQRSAPGFLCGMNRMGMLAADGMLILLWTWGR